MVCAALTASAPSAPSASKNARRKYCLIMPAAPPADVSAYTLANEFRNGAGQARQIVRRDGKGRRQIDDVAERPDEHALPDEALAQAVKVADAVKFDHADRTAHTHVFHTAQIATRRQLGFQLLRYCRHLL